MEKARRDGCGMALLDLNILVLKFCGNLLATYLIERP